MLISACIATILLFSFLLLRNLGAKRLFNVPWYYITLSLDIGGVKGKYYRYKGIIGVPDAVFKHVLLPRYIVCELKGRKLNGGRIRRFEYGQLMLYIGILKKKHFFSTVKGILAYKDDIKYSNFEPVIFDEIVSKKSEALKILNRLH